VVTDDPGTRLELKAFHGTLVREDIPTNIVELPIVNQVDKKTVGENFRQIRVDIGCLIGDVIGNTIDHSSQGDMAPGENSSQK
jgi:hypothetical protein